jgi:hypothetical protein
MLRRSWDQRKTCSRECGRELIARTARANPNCGGETNYKRYHYNGVLMDSAWEVEIAQWMDEHKVRWERSRKLMFWWTDTVGAKHRYYPDFYLPDYNVYLDPKNRYLISRSREKMEAVQRENEIVIVWGLKGDVLQWLQSTVSAA